MSNNVNSKSFLFSFFSFGGVAIKLVAWAQWKAAMFSLLTNIYVHVRKDKGGNFVLKNWKNFLKRTRVYSGLPRVSHSLRQYQNLQVHCYLNYMNMSTIAQPRSPPLPFACSPPVGFCLERWTDSNQGSFKSALTHWSLKSFMLSSPFPVKAWFLLLAESTNPFPFKVLKNQQFLVHFSTAVSFPLSLLVFLFFILFNILLYSSSSSLMWLLCASRFPSSLSDWRLPWIILVLSVF